MAEVKIIVPIEKDVKDRLVERADRNGRSMCREASKIITKAVAK